MKRILILLLLFPSLAFAQAGGTWFPQGTVDATHGYLRPVNVNWGLKVPGLATSSTGCLSVNATGWISSSGSACASGSSSGVTATSTNPFMATYFIATSSTATSTFAGGLKLAGAEIGTSTTLYTIDGNRTDNYPQSGSDQFPYKTVPAAIARSWPSAAGYTYLLAPATYVDGAPDTFPNAPIVIYGNASILVEPSGVNFTNSYDIYDLTISACGSGIHQSDTALTVIHQMTNGVVSTCGAIFQLDGNATLSGMTLAPSTLLSVSNGALVNVSATAIFGGVNNYGALNLNNVFFQYASSTAYGITATTSSWLSNGAFGNINILGATMISTSTGGLMNIANGATSTPNNLLGIAGFSVGAGVTAGSAATTYCDVEIYSLVTGSLIAPSGTNFLPCVDAKLNVLLTLGVATTSPGTTFAVNGAGVIAGPVTVQMLTSTSTATSTFAGGLSVLNFAQTGTATSTATNGFQLTGGCFADSGGCLTHSGGGSVTSINNGSTGSTLTFSGGPITTSGTINGELNLTHANIWAALQTSAAAGTTTFAGGVEANGIGSPWFSGTSTTLHSTFTYASTTQLTAGSGSVTCASLAIGGGCMGLYLNGSALGFTNAVSGFSWNGTALYPNTDSARDLGIDSTNRWRNLFVLNASTTYASMATWLGIPNAANPTVSAAAGTLALDTTAASTSLQIGDGTAVRTIYAIQDRPLLLASSTLAYMGAFGAAGSTTLRLANFTYPVTLKSIYCKTDIGTAWVGFGIGTATTTEVQCTTAGAQVFPASNNTWTSRQDFFVEVGFSASAPNRITITAGVRPDQD